MGGRRGWWCTLHKPLQKLSTKQGRGLEKVSRIHMARLHDYPSTERHSFGNPNLDIWTEGRASLRLQRCKHCLTKLPVREQAFETLL